MNNKYKGGYFRPQNSRFKHFLFRKYTDIHNGIFIMSMQQNMFQYDKMRLSGDYH